MSDAADALEHILRAENEALERHDADAAVRWLDGKIAAARALADEPLTVDVAERLAELTERNQRLLERAIDVQGQILSIVVNAARTAPTAPRYGAAGRTVPGDSRNALVRQA